MVAMPFVLANTDIEFIEATGWNILADDIAID
jgi:hypothetical protein